MTTTLANQSLHNRCVQASLDAMANKGYELLDFPYECEDSFFDIVAKDDDVLVFAKVLCGQLIMPNMNTGSDTRARFEKAAANYLASNDEVNIRVRFDIISYLIIDDHKAFVRYHRNALAT